MMVRVYVPSTLFLDWSITHGCERTNVFTMNQITLLHWPSLQANTLSIKSFASPVQDLVTPITSICGPSPKFHNSTTTPTTPWTSQVSQHSSNPWSGPPGGSSIGKLTTAQKPPQQIEHSTYVAFEFLFNPHANWHTKNSHRQKEKPLHSGGTKLWICCSRFPNLRIAESTGFFDQLANPSTDWLRSH